MKEKVFDLLNKIDPTNDFARAICAGLKSDEAYRKMFTFLNNNPNATVSDVEEKLSAIRGIPSWNAELEKFVPPEE